MNVDEALDNIVVNSEEKNSIENYLGSFHTRMNLLVNLTPKNSENLNNYMPKTSEELKQRIMEFVNIYSAMLKSNSKSENLSNKTQLVRGTTVERINEMEEVSCSFLSTTNDVHIAKSFTIGYNAKEIGAFLRFKVADGIPFLDASKYTENVLGEKEIIFSPFCNIVNKKLIRKQFGMDEYMVEIEPPNLQKVPKEQLENILNEVILGYEQNIKDIEELNWLTREIDRLYLNRNKANNIEYKIFLTEEIEKNEEKSSKLKQSTNLYKEKLQTVLKGLCKQKEIEITSAREFLEQEKAKRIKEMDNQHKDKNNEKNIQEKAGQTDEEIRKELKEERKQIDEEVKQKLTKELEKEILSNRK